MRCNSYQAFTPTETITLGSSDSPVRSAYLAVSGDDLVNYQAMAQKCAFLGLSNLFTEVNNFKGDYNTFLGELRCNNYQAFTPASGNIDWGTQTSGTNNFCGNNSKTKMRGTQIDITPSGNLTLGSATSKNTFIQNTDGLIIGTNPTTYDPVNGIMSPYGMRICNYAGNSFIDFHSNTVAGTAQDSRIISSGGTNTAYGATLSIYSSRVNSRKAFSL